MKKIRWVKNAPYSTAYVEVFEKDTWVHYRQSSIYKADFFSDGTGHQTFVNGLKNGYISEGLFVKSQ